MKRLLTLALLVLALSGCGAPASEETAAPEASQPEAAQATEPVGLFDPAASLALDPNGAVYCYSIADHPAEAVRVMGEDLVLFSSEETTTLTRLSGEKRYVSATARLSLLVSADGPGTQVSTKGITYYDPEVRELVFLKNTLEEANRIALPDTIRGEPILSRDRKTLYYATADALRYIDLDSKMDRLLLQTAYDSLELRELHLDDTVLECGVLDGTDRFTICLSARTGEILKTQDGALALSTGKELYFARVEDRVYPELLTGSGDGVYTLETADYLPELTIPVMELESLVTVAYEGDSTRLELYDLRLGDRAASLTLPGRGDCRSLAGDPATGCLWMLWYDGAETHLLRWDPEKSRVQDDRVYRLPRRTAQSPDMAGLDACAAAAEEIGGKYGVDIRIWQDAAALHPGDYAFEAEYRVPLIRHHLEAVEALLAAFPEVLLENLTAEGQQLRICLTGAITGQDDRGLDAAVGVQFWDEEGNPCVAVTAAEGMTDALTHELYHIIDSRVLMACSGYDDWNDLNPKGFDYDYDYALNAQRTDDKWTTGKDRAFIDTYSMSFPKEDRARIMEYAMGEGNEECFESKTMQKKLRTLCRGIRQAFGLRKSPETFPWEQYLESPLAYKKK